MPIDYKNYPPNWKTRIRPAILERAGHCCEECGVPNYAIGLRGKQGNFYTEEDLNQHGAIDDEYKVIRIVLTVSHTDHDITNNNANNLRALCQRCHLNHDREHNKKKRQLNRRKKEMERGQMAFDFGEEEVTWG